MLPRTRRSIITLSDAIRAGRLLWYRCDCGNTGWFNPAEVIPTRCLAISLTELPGHLRCVESGVLCVSVVAVYPIGISKRRG